MSYTSNIGGKFIVTAKGNINDFAQEDIIIDTNKTINIKGDEKGLSYNTPETFKNDSENFEVSLSINKKINTIVPLGILDFENNYENSFFIFDYSLKMTNLDSLNFQILDENGTQIYQMTNLAPIVVTAKRKPKLFMELKTAPPPFDPLKPTKTFDFQKIIDNYLYPDLTHTGNYCIFWDGFDNDEVYDSTRFDGKKLKAKITAKKGGTTKTQEVEFEVSRSEVDWVDVKIDKKTKRIDVNLRVNLTDGGANGLDCSTYNGGNEFSSEGFSSNQPDPFRNVNVQICDWDKIPKTEIIVGKPPITTRIKSFTDLEKLALDGLNYHWGRNKNHAVAKDVKIVSESYEVFVNSVNSKEKSMDDVDLVYNTNGKWMRSGNPGTATWNPVSWVGNAISREAICYNVGYIYEYFYKNKWGYQSEIEEDLEYKFTSAHEIGHEILKSYGGTAYSYGHKGSVNVVTQNMKIRAHAYPMSGEIDIMPYYPSSPPSKLYNRYIAAEKDVLSLIWLTKIQIK